MENRIDYDDKGNAVSFTGPQAVAVFQAAALRSGLGLMAVGIKPHRTWTSLRAALDKASEYTGQRYAGKKDIERARSDLSAWVQQRKAELS
jgi:hypothetical protein